MKSLIITQKSIGRPKQATTCLSVYFFIALTLFAINTQIEIQAVNFVVLFIIGYMTWTFTEYYFHRFIMHDSKSNSYQSHMYHHKNPSHIKVTGLHRTIICLTGVAIISLAVYLDNYFTCFAGFYIGFVIYSLLHVILHHRYGKYIVPRVQIAHIHHHGKYPETGYSFSTIVWDYMFGTMAPKDAVITEQMKNFYFKHE